MDGTSDEFTQILHKSYLLISDVSPKPNINNDGQIIPSALLTTSESTFIVTTIKITSIINYNIQFLDI